MASKKLKDHERLDRMAAKVDGDGNIIVAIRGPGVLSDVGMEAGKWVRLENDLRAIETTLLEKQPQLRVGKDKRVGEKPYVELILNKDSIRTKNDHAVVRIKPLTENVPRIVKLQVNGQIQEVNIDEDVIIESEVPQRLTVKIVDPRVNCKIRTRMIIARERNEEI